MRQFVYAFAALALLAGCAAEPVWAPEEQVTAAAYREAGPATITLYTMVSNSTGSGFHSGLLINASQRVLFDPAGTFTLSFVPERNDVHYGITEPVREFYESYHARVTYHVIALEMEVSAELAEQALALVEANGAVPKSFCASHTSRILRDLPGFDQVIQQRFFPEKLMADFRGLPNVRETKIVEDDDSDKRLALLSYEAQVAEGRVSAP